VKYAWIEEQSDQFAVSRMCQVLRVSRTGYLQWRVREPSSRQRSNDKLGAQLRVIHAENDRSYGRIRLWKALIGQGQRVGQERVRRLMKLNGLRSVHRRPYRVTTCSAHSKPVAENLLDRRFGQRIRSRWPRICSIVALVRPKWIARGWRISPMYQPARAGFIWRRYSTWRAGVLWAGRCRGVCRQSSYVTRWRWPISGVGRPRG